MGRFGSEHGWQLEAHRRDLTLRWQGAPFGVGDRRRADMVLTGSYRGREVTAFDYSFRTRSASGQGEASTVTHRFAVCTTAVPVALAQVEVLPTNALARLAYALGAPRVQLESEDFNRRFAVRSPDPATAVAVLHPRTMELLLGRIGTRAVGDVSWRITGTDIVCWASGRAEPEQVLARLDLLADVVSGVPSFLWRDAINGVEPSAVDALRTHPGAAPDHSGDARR